jgi:hypothetical protein
VIGFDFYLQGGNVFLPYLRRVVGDPFRSPLADGCLSSGSSYTQLAFVLDDTTGAVQSPLTVSSVIGFDFSLQGGNVFLPYVRRVVGDPFRSPLADGWLSSGSPYTQLAFVLDDTTGAVQSH